jgi:hypothetical protein
MDRTPGAKSSSQIDAKASKKWQMNIIPQNRFPETTEGGYSLSAFSHSPIIFKCAGA